MGRELANANAGGLPPALQSTLDASVSRLAAALPAHTSPEKMIQLFSVLSFRTPKLQECVPESIVTSLITCGVMGWDLNPGRNEAFLIPRYNKNIGALECQLQPGYKGLEKLATDTGAVLYIHPREVYERDAFEVEYDSDLPDGLRFRHKPHLGADRGDITHVYALAKMANGDRIIEVMTWEEVEKIRQGSSESKAIWDRHWKEMGLKTIVKRVAKRMPRSFGADPARLEAFNKLQEAITLDDREYLEGPAVPAHHAVNHNNGTGHGSGAYAPPEDVKAYQDWVKWFVDDVNQKWADRWAPTHGDGDYPGEVKDLLSTYQIRGHLTKWAWQEGLLNMPEKPKADQADKFVAILFTRWNEKLKKEARDYGASKWRETMLSLRGRVAGRVSEDATAAVLEPTPEDESQAMPESPINPENGDPEVDYPEGY